MKKDCRIANCCACQCRFSRVKVSTILGNGSKNNQENTAVRKVQRMSQNRNRPSFVLWSEVDCREERQMNKWHCHQSKLVIMSRLCQTGKMMVVVAVCDGNCCLLLLWSIVFSGELLSLTHSLSTGSGWKRGKVTDWTVNERSKMRWIDFFFWFPYSTTTDDGDAVEHILQWLLNNSR